MNIFVLDKNPILAAQMQCDKHVVKMVLESAQMLSTVRTGLGLDAPYKPTHKNHPCTKWVLQNKVHYFWLYEHFKALCSEYTDRYNKIHKCSQYLELFNISNPTESQDYFESLGYALAMPEEYKTTCPVESYRAYYKGDKAYMAKWDKLNNTPKWWN